MKTHKKLNRAASIWSSFVTRIERAYAYRVKRPCYLWRKYELPVEHFPGLPWWSRFARAFLVAVGRPPYPVRLRRGQRVSVPHRRGARVYRLVEHGSRRR